MSESDGLELDNDAVKLELNRDGCSALISRADGSITFGPLIARANLVRESGRAHSVCSSLVPGWRIEEAEVETPLGSYAGLRAALEDAPGLPVRLAWEWALVGEEDALARLSLENRGEENFRLHELIPAGYRGADPGLQMGAGYVSWRFFRAGWQSWSPAGSIGAIEPDFRPNPLLPFSAGTKPRAPHSKKPGEKVSDWMAQLVEPKLKLGCLLGFITSADLNGRVEFEVKYDRFRRLEAVADAEKRLVRPGEKVASEWCLVSLSRNPLGQQARYYELWGKAMQARKSAPRTGWCSWYFAFTNVSEQIVNRNLKAAEEFKGQLEVVQVDDGYEECVGDWLEWNRKFTSRPKELAARIRERGFTPGLWLAPFLVSRSSRLYKSHPEWVVRTPRGRPKIAFIHPQWKGKLMYALDTTRAEARQWLANTIQTVVHDSGFNYLKLDFLYSAALPGVRHDPSATGASALRQGLLTIREAAGDDTYLLGCGCPLGPAIGIMDAMRISPDIDVHWQKRWIDRLTGAPVGPGAKNCLTNNLARLLMHGRLWTNDPDCLVLREERGGLTAAEVQSELTVAYLTGGATVISEDLPALSRERLEWARRLLPPLDRLAISLDLFEKGVPQKVMVKKVDGALVALFNWASEPKTMELNLKKLGFNGAWRVFDFWAEEYLGVATDKMKLPETPAHGVKYLRLTRSHGRPCLIGTTLHMGMGETGVTTREQGSGLEVRLELPGARRGRLWVALPGGRLIKKEIAFEDRWEGLIE